MIVDFLSHQTDFLLLLSGLAFACIGIICRALARTDSRLPWKWCALFGFSQALHESLSLLTLSHERATLVVVIGPLLNAVSFLCLAEFARSGIASVRTRGPGLWVHLVLLALASSIWGTGAADHDAAVRYSLGAVSALAAAWLLWHVPVPNVSHEARGRGVSSAAMAGLGLAAVAGSPAAHTPPDAGILAGVLIQLLQAVFALAIAWALCRRYQALRRLAFGDRAARAAGRISRVAAGGLAITIGLGWIFAQESGRAADHGQRRVILTVTRTAAAAIDADSILRLAGTEADLVSPDYERLKRQLVAVRRAFPDCRFAYLMGMRDRQVIFLADSEPESSEDYSPPGQAYEEASAELIEVFRTGEEFMEGPATDRWGTWVSGLVPIVQNRSGRVVAVLGQDVDASRWAHVIARSRMGTLLITLMVAALILVFFAVQQRSQETSTAIGDSERRYRGLVEGSPNCVVLLDPTGRVLMVNRNGAAALGWATAEILGRAFSELWPEPTREVIEAELTRAARGEQVSFESAYLRPDGRDMTWHAALNPIVDADGIVRRLVGILTDITERKAAGDRLRRANRELEVTNERLERAIDRANELAVMAEEASKAKSAFLANMSHEIRTPMNGVIGMAGVLLDTHLTPEQREYAEIVRSSGESLLAIINDVLDFSKIEAGRMDLEVLAFDIRTVLDETATLLAVNAHGKGIELISIVEPTVPPVVRGDAGRLRQILINLAGNAVKFTDRGEVSIHAGVDSETPSSVTLRFEVKDTGIGISSDALPLLFRPFGQADTSTTRRFGGTGLGLSISKRLAEMMGGDIGVVSAPGHGSTFWFTAGFERSTTPVRASEVLGGDISGSRILVVDDNQTNRRLLAVLLTSWGCEHAEAAEGPSALDRLVEAQAEARPFQLALIDMQMPQMDGIELGTQIRQDPRISETKLVMLSSLGKASMGGRARAVGFSAFLMKPIRQVQLRQCLEMVLGVCPDGPVASAAGSHAPDRRGFRILVAEDNATSQRVASAVLEKLGCRVDVAANGLEALRALETAPYDLVLMDCQMPEMDGYEASRVIRDPSSSVLKHEIPIIAMTAYAMESDRQQCLQAGMNDYIAKPVTPRALRAAVERWVNRTDNVAAAGIPPPPETPSLVFDLTGLMERTMDDEALANELAAMFVEDVPHRISAMREALSRSDLVAAARIAHTLRGAAGSVGAAAIMATAARIEHASASGDGRVAESLVAAAEAQLGEVIAAMRSAGLFGGKGA